MNLKRSKRKAGILAAGSAMIAQGLIPTKEPIKPYMRDTTAIEQYLSDEGTAIDKMKTELTEGRNKKIELPNFGDPYSVYDQVDSQKVGDQAKGSPSVFKPVSSNISAQSAYDPGKVMSKDAIRGLAINSGFTPSEANIVVGIAGGESGFDPTNSTERSGLKARTGEDSVGLMQINWGYHKDKG